MATDRTTCKYCGTRIIFPRTAEDKKMPPVNYGEDPIGTVAVQHTNTGAWVGRWLAKDQHPNVPEKRHALHWCDGLERQRRRRRGKTLTRSGGRPPRRRTTQPLQGTLT